MVCAPGNAGKPEEWSAKGTGAVLECGTSTKLYLSIDRESGKIESARFTSSGCGWAVASAQALTELLFGKELKELHALEELESLVDSALGGVPRKDLICSTAAFDAARSALTEYRRSQVGEWSGDSPLVCSCFGVSEDTIEDAARCGIAVTVEQVGDHCGAGTGCGSCRMLIREIIESV